MFGFSGPELLLTFAIALLVLGPQQLKQFVQFIAKGLRAIRNMTSDLSQYLESTIDDNSKK